MCSLLVSGQKRETDAVKLMSVRAGVLDMAQSWEAMGKKCILLAQSQKVGLHVCVCVCVCVCVWVVILGNP